MITQKFGTGRLPLVRFSIAVVYENVVIMLDDPVWLSRREIIKVDGGVREIDGVHGCSNSGEGVGSLGMEIVIKYANQILEMNDGGLLRASVFDHAPRRAGRLDAWMKGALTLKTQFQHATPWMS